MQREQVDTSPDSFWIRHYRLDDRLSRIISNLPIGLVLPLNITNMHAIQMNYNLHAAYICLHHAVIENQSGTLPPTLRQSSLGRLKTSATEIVNILKLVPHSIVNLVRNVICSYYIWILYANRVTERSLECDAPVFGQHSLCLASQNGSRNWPQCHRCV